MFNTANFENDANYALFGFTKFAFAFAHFAPVEYEDSILFYFF